MTRPRCRLLARLTAATALAAATLLVISPGPAAAATSATPLRVSIDTLSPATIPRHGHVTLTGSITNRSHQTWTGLNVYLLTSPTPLRSRAELANAAGTEEAAEVGGRRTGPGLYESVGDLRPGQTVTYRLSLRRRDLGISAEPGVYWVGVHVLGTADGIRDSVADGRARTFMPLLPPSRSAAGQRAHTRVALVVPLRTPVRRGPAGRLLDVSTWNQLVSPEGRLDRLLRLSAAARGGVTWVVDPAVVDAVQSLARGNPDLDPAPETSAGASPSSSASPDSQADGQARSTGTSRGSADDSAKVASGPARAWLAEFRRQARRHTVLALPYGDLDVSAALQHPGIGSLYPRAVSLSAATLKRNGVDDPAPAVDPLSGYLAPAALRRLGPGTPVLLSQRAVGAGAGPVLDAGGEAPVVVSDAAAGAGGPKPNSPYSALAVRQRLLSDAALHALSSSRDEPLVVSLPDDWDPGAEVDQAAFFAGLRQSWLQLTDLPSVVTTTPTSSAAQTPLRLAYPAAERRAELPEANLRASAALAAAGALYDRLLTHVDTVEDAVQRVALLASSATGRAAPDAQQALAADTLAHVHDQLDAVTVEGPPFVMMSGESGPISVTLVNGLPQTVTVGLSMSTPGSDLRISHIRPVRLGPGRRTSVRLDAHSDDIGVHAVTLHVTDARGTPLGSRTSFNVRTSHVSTVIWVVMSTGGALLLIAIVVRLVRRVARRKATPGPLLPRESSPLPGRAAPSGHGVDV